VKPLADGERYALREATREQYDEIPPRVEYELTEDGEELAERLRPVLEWVQSRET